MKLKEVIQFHSVSFYPFCVLLPPSVCYPHFSAPNDNRASRKPMPRLPKSSLRFDFQFCNQSFNTTMKLHFLIPTLKCACSLALATHRQGQLGERAALIIAFDIQKNPHVLFFADTNCPNLPVDFIYGTAIVDVGLAGICNTLSGLGLDHESAVERMTFNILAHMNVLLYALKPAHDLTLQLAGRLDYHAVCGISGGIANEKIPENKPLPVAEHSQRN